MAKDKMTKREFLGFIKDENQERRQTKNKGQQGVAHDEVELGLKAFEKFSENGNVKDVIGLSRIMEDRRREAQERLESEKEIAEMLKEQGKEIEEKPMADEQKDKEYPVESWQEFKDKMIEESDKICGDTLREKQLTKDEQKEDK